MEQRMFETVEDQTRTSSDHSGSFMYWSIPFYWLRERRLSKKSIHWIPSAGVVESSHRTKGGYKQTIRAEMWYSYSFGGKNYRRHAIRDCCWALNSANRLVGEHQPGQKIKILVNLENPAQSYCSSGFGWVEPFLTLFLSGLGTLLLISIVIGAGIIPMLKRLGW